MLSVSLASSSTDQRRFVVVKPLMLTSATPSRLVSPLTTSFSPAATVRAPAERTEVIPSANSMRSAPARSLAAAKASSMLSWPSLALKPPDAVVTMKVAMVGNPPLVCRRCRFRAVLDGKCDGVTRAALSGHVRSFE